MDRHKLAYFMSLRGFNNVKLAEAVGVHSHYISDLRRGVRKPSKPLMNLLAIVLETTPEELQEGGAEVGQIQQQATVSE